jgi:glycosyltransferase involved in cell wall biosynthesis
MAEFETATVVITTRNRRDDLLQAIASALAQTAKPEVLVIDDGSTDGTAVAVSREFPSVRLHRSEKSFGLVVQRNRAAKLTANPIIFSLDDDAIFSTSRIVEDTLREFEHPRVGAVAIPYADVNQSPDIHQRAPEPQGVYAAYDFKGTAHALRRDVFLALGGYREILVHQGEEEDYCVRMLNAGWITRLGNAGPIHHFESPRRSWSRMDFYGARNKILYAWHNIPFPAVALQLAGRTAKAIVFSLQPGRMLTRCRGLLNGYYVCATGNAKRRPVNPPVYQLSQELKFRRMTLLEEIADRLPGLNAEDVSSHEVEKLVERHNSHGRAPLPGKTGAD